MKLKLLELNNNIVFHEFEIVNTHRIEYVASNKHESMFYVALEFLPKGFQFSTLSSRLYHILANQLQRLPLTSNSGGNTIVRSI